ncbi:peptide/nickel transport system permease protein [Stella humosa]|uniref:Peptide/nickel transport system permease protein n=1 Tax=Stella humosa TaxID=94 RepID=A0A3N1MGF5_9PROT|nr:ABC transporter permease [Stella humosa]ROQ00276.1 peptide/nickel transport system permease protein [Stella humosa]BBK30486.1 ABC transporter permease [Stella humosa]
MTLFLLRRFGTLIGTLLAASLVVFLVLEVLPGDPAQVMLGVDAQPDTVEALRRKLGLDRPPVERYLAWVVGLATGDLGISYTYSVPVSELIAERLVLTIPLALIAMALTVVLALSLGLYAASHHGRPGDWGVMAFGQLGIAIPNFWFAILLILYFSVHLGWFSAGGFPGWGAGILPALQSLLLPAISLAIVQAAILARVTRSAVLEVLREDFVRTARAKGLSRRQALWRHVLRNALIPVVTIMGLQFANLLTGTIIIENVFYLPGVGRLVFQAITQRDLIVVKDVVVLIAALVVVVNFLVDVLYAVIDPRLRSRR